MGTSKATGMIRDVSDLVEVVMGCSSSEADRVGAAICRSPEAAQKLAMACGVSVGAFGAGGMLTVVGQGGALVGGVPIWAIGVALSSAGGLGAKRFCSALANQTGLSVEAAMRMYLLPTSGQ